ncbi:unnamed protein product [[Candida] boidinii]|nr:unnamed protein product [[Candida] boidinii]
MYIQTPVNIPNQYVQQIENSNMNLVSENFQYNIPSNNNYSYTNEPLEYSPNHNFVQLQHGAASTATSGAPPNPVSYAAGFQQQYPQVQVQQPLRRGTLVQQQQQTPLAAHVPQKLQPQQPQQVSPIQQSIKSSVSPSKPSMAPSLSKITLVYNTKSQTYTEYQSNSEDIAKLDKGKNIIITDPSSLSDDDDDDDESVRSEGGSQHRSSIKAKRSRKGCLTCRHRKKRCCENKPRCKECERLGLNCKWPMPGTENKNRSKNNQFNHDEMKHEIYGTIKILRGIVDYRVEG